MKHLLFLLFFTILGLGACQSDANNKQQQASAKTAASGPLSSGIILSVPDQTATTGQTLCLPVQVQQFDQILSMQYTMHFDPTVLKFKEINGFQLKDLGKSNFGTNRATNGIITTSWYDLDVKGISVNTNTPIYQVCFEAIGTSGQTSPVEFNGDPVIVEISNATGEVIGFSARKAKVTIE